MELSKFFGNCRLITAELSSIELIDDDQAAVYAFYDRLHFEAHRFADSIDEFKTRHGRNAELIHDEWPFSLKISFRGNPTRFKGEATKELKKFNKSRVSELSDVLQFLSILNEPLYIGKTNDLKLRFRAHHDKDFLFRMKRDYHRPPSEFVMLIFLCNKDNVRLLESILIQLINPPHCKQKS